MLNIIYEIHDVLVKELIYDILTLKTIYNNLSNMSYDDLSQYFDEYSVETYNTNSSKLYEFRSKCTTCFSDKYSPIHAEGEYPNALCFFEVCGRAPTRNV